MDFKHYLKSKTLWMNVLLIAGGIISWATGEVAAGAALTFTGFLNTVLRIVTKEGLSWNLDEEKESQ